MNVIRFFGVTGGLVGKITAPENEDVQVVADRWVAAEYPTYKALPAWESKPGTVNAVRFTVEQVED